MSTTTAAADRDERTTAVENAGYRWAYLLMSFGLLGLVLYRSAVYRESPWDLMALVVLGGVVTTAYQWSHKVLSSRWATTALFSVVVAAALAAGAVWLRR